MADFNSIPIRINGQRFDASWWNTIRDALISSDATPAFANYASDAEYEAAKGSAGTEGDFYYNTTTDFLKYHNGSAWLAVADESSAQAFTNKVIDGSLNTISNLTHGDQVDNPTNNVHGVTTDIVGVGDVQSLENKTLDVDLNTVTNIEVDNLKAGVLDTDLNSVSASDDTIPSAKAAKDYTDVTTGGAISAHSVLTTTHGTTTAIVGVDDVQTLTNKTIGDNLTVTGDLTVVGDYYGGDVIEVTDPAITVNKDGSQSSANNVAGIEVDMSDADNARITYDSSLTSKWKVGDVTSQDEIVTATDAQDVSNKAIIDPSRLDVKKDTYANLVTYASTASDGQLCFATDSLKTYVVHTSLLNEVGGGGEGQGGINYITNYDAEEGLDDWTVSGTIPFSQETTSPMFGTASFKLASAGSDYSGDYVYTNFTVDNALIYNIIAGEFWVRNVDLTTGDLQVRIYDVDNAAYISLVSGEDILASTIDTPHKFKFQTTDSVNYRLEIYIATTSTTAYDFIFDNVVVGPEKSAVTGLAGWKQYDISSYLSGSGLTINRAVAIPYKTLDGTWRIKGNVDYVSFGTSGTYVMTIAGIVFPAITQAVTFSADDTTYATIMYKAYANPSTNTISMQSDQASLNWAVPAPQISFDLELASQPTWAEDTSNVVLSETTMNREVFAHLYKGALQTVPNNTHALLLYQSVKTDTTNSFNSSSGVYTCPEDGTYEISTYLMWDVAAWTIGNVYQINLRVNDLNVAGLDRTEIEVTRTGYQSSQGTVKLKLKKDDTVKLYAYQNSGAGKNVYYGIETAYLTIEKTNVGTQTIAASEKVAALYRDSSAQSIPDITQTLVTWNTKDLDTHNALSAGKFKAPKPGIVSINGAFTFTSATSLYTLSVLIYNYTQATYKYVIEENFNGSRSGKLLSAFNAKLLVDTGDELGLLVVQDDGSTASRSFEPDTNYNFIEFTME